MSKELLQRDVDAYERDLETLYRHEETILDLLAEARRQMDLGEEDA